MWVLLIRALLSGLVGSVFGKWFLTTRLGVKTQASIDTFMQTLTKKHNLMVLQREEEWMQKYPNLAKRIELLEQNKNR